MLFSTFGLCTAQAQTPLEATADTATDGQFVRDELLVAYQPGIPEAMRDQARMLIWANLIEDITPPEMERPGHGVVELLKLPPGMTVTRGVAMAQRHGSVRFAEPNWIHTHGAVSNDNDYTQGNLWGMYGDATTHAKQYGRKAGEAWAVNHTGSSSVFVGVVDEGAQ